MPVDEKAVCVVDEVFCCKWHGSPLIVYDKDFIISEYLLVRSLICVVVRMVCFALFIITFHR